MLIDRLTRTPSAYMLSPGLLRALEYLRATELLAADIGRHDIDGDRIFALVQEYTTRPAADCKWEAHRAYVDVQCVVAGVERMGYRDIAGAAVREPYDAARDVAFFDPGADAVTVHEGMFAIFWPHDVHAPQGAAGSPALVRKVVVKVAVSE